MVGVLIVGIDGGHQSDVFGDGGDRRQQGKGLELIADGAATGFRGDVPGTADEIGHEEGVELGGLRQFGRIEPPVQVRAAVARGTGMTPGRDMMAEALEKDVQYQLSFLFFTHNLTPFPCGRSVSPRYRMSVQPAYARAFSSNPVRFHCSSRAPGVYTCAPPICSAMA